MDLQYQWNMYARSAISNRIARYGSVTYFVTCTDRYGSVSSSNGRNINRYRLDTDTHITRYRSVPLKPKSPRAGTARDKVTPPSPCETRRRLVSPLCRERSRSKERASRFGIQRNGQPFAREAPRGQAKYVRRSLKCATSSARCYILKGTVGTVLAKSRNLTSAFAGAEQGTSCSARRSNPKGIMVSETSSRKNAKRKVAPIGQISRRDRSWFSRGTIMCSEPYMLRKSTSKQYLHKAQWTERATRSCCMILNEVMH
ncbi:hypothetical protein BHE74_00003799 [Ensete ventricosum]|nr:hypothetical protein BHE74_00003799 [Ensete ventricosum]